jgi:putative ATPase
MEGRNRMTKVSEDLFKPDPKNIPLAERCRPKTISDVVGHAFILGNDGPLKEQINSGYLPSIIFWGPPGVGKTTIARVLCSQLNYYFHNLSAISSGVKDLKEIIEESRNRVGLYQQNTVLFIDEIHRFNKLQQDALLHAVERGEVILIGATTENPSFEVNAALLSRCTIIKLDDLSKEDLQIIIERALNSDAILSKHNIHIEKPELLMFYGNGDARRTLNLLEAGFYLADRATDTVKITEAILKRAMTQSPLLYDKMGDYHYDIISAFIKSIRGSDPDAAVYWLARMLEAGEDPLFISRRLIILASEDVGNAEPYALSLANAGYEAVRNIGLPEARIILSQVTTYLASVPKSNAAYLAIESATEEVKRSGSLPVPLHLRNAPTKLMKQLNYGGDYKYPHDFPEHFVNQKYLPENLDSSPFYLPTNQGRESKLKDYLNRICQKRQKERSL